MILTELLGNNCIRHYSDSNFKIIQNETGIVFDDVVDLVPCRYTYDETDELIETDGEEMSEIAEKAAAYDILVGVSE